ncbi:hypothetical protein KFL_016930020, partial [Klebsormidium nitens]
MDRYVLARLEEAQRGLWEYFRSCNDQALASPDLRMMVNIHEWIMEAPVQRPQDDFTVNLGPPPATELGRRPGSAAHGTRFGVPLSLLQAHFRRRYGTNWVEGFLQGRVVNYPPGTPNVQVPFRQYPIPTTGTLVEPPVSREEKPILAKAALAHKKRPRDIPGLRVLTRDEWEDEPDGADLIRVRSLIDRRSPTPPPGTGVVETEESEGPGEVDERGVKRPATAVEGVPTDRVSKVAKGSEEAAGATGGGAAKDAGARREKERAKKSTAEGASVAAAQTAVIGERELPTRLEATTTSTPPPVGAAASTGVTSAGVETCTTPVLPPVTLAATGPSAAEAAANAARAEEVAAMRELMVDEVEGEVNDLEKALDTYVQMTTGEREDVLGIRLYMQILHLAQWREVEIVRAGVEKDPIPRRLRAGRPPLSPAVLQNMENYAALTPIQRMIPMGSNLFGAIVQGRAAEVYAFRSRRPAQPLPSATGQKRRAETSPEEGVRAKKVAETGAEKKGGKPPVPGTVTSSSLTGAAEAKKGPAAATGPEAAAGGGERLGQVNTPAPGAGEEVGGEAIPEPQSPNFGRRRAEGLEDCAEDVLALKLRGEDPTAKAAMDEAGYPPFEMSEEEQLRLVSTLAASGTPRQREVSRTRKGLKRMAANKVFQFRMEKYRKRPPKDRPVWYIDADDILEAPRLRVMLDEIGAPQLPGARVEI